jgi:hypothetical protein
MESACHVCHNLLQDMNGAGDRRFQKGRGKKCVEKVVCSSLNERVEGHTTLNLLSSYLDLAFPPQLLVSVEMRWVLLPRTQKPGFVLLPPQACIYILTESFQCMHYLRAWSFWLTRLEFSIYKFGWFYLSSLSLFIVPIFMFMSEGWEIVSKPLWMWKTLLEALIKGNRWLHSRTIPMTCLVHYNLDEVQALNSMHEIEFGYITMCTIHYIWKRAR